MPTNTSIEIKRPVFFVFDVEAVGFLGDAFWVGWVIVDATGRIIDDGGSLRAPIDMAAGTQSAHEWVSENVPTRTATEAVSQQHMRNKFWHFWSVAHQEYGAILAADCPWPVEARFLLDCLADQPHRKFPYPIIDVASVRLAAGLDPLGEETREIGELPRHSPQADARQSARLLIEALERTNPWLLYPEESRRPIGSSHRQHLIKLRTLQNELAAEIDWFQQYGLSEGAYPPEDHAPLADPPAPKQADTTEVVK